MKKLSKQEKQTLEKKLKAAAIKNADWYFDELCEKNELEYNVSVESFEKGVKWAINYFKKIA